MGGKNKKVVNLLLFVLLTGMVVVTIYTDLKYRKIYNKFLLPCLTLSLAIHFYDGTLSSSLIAMMVAFSFFYLAYCMRMTSPGDVKLIAVMASVVADIHIVGAGIVLYMGIQFLIAIYALVRTCMKQKMSPKAVLKHDAIGFATKSGPVIEPIHFPGAVLIGGSVWGAALFYFIVS